MAFLTAPLAILVQNREPSILELTILTLLITAGLVALIVIPASFCATPRGGYPLPEEELQQKKQLQKVLEDWLLIRSKQVATRQ